MSDDFTIDENGNITGSFQLGSKKVVFHTTISKIEQYERNKENPNSREKVIIDDDEIVLPFKGFFEDIVLGTIGLEGDIRYRMFGINVSARAGGYNNVIIKREDYEKILQNKKKKWNKRK